MLTLALVLAFAFALLLVTLIVRFQSAFSADRYEVECDAPEYEDAPDMMRGMDQGVMATIGTLAPIRPVKGESITNNATKRTPVLTKVTRRIGIDAPEVQLVCGEASECETGCFEAITSAPRTAGFLAMKDTLVDFGPPRDVKGRFYKRT